MVLSGRVKSYVLHDAAVGGGRAAEVGDLQADIQVGCGIRHCGGLVLCLREYFLNHRQLLPGTVVSRTSTSTTSLGSVAAETRGAARARTVVNREVCILIK